MCNNTTSDSLIFSTCRLQNTHKHNPTAFTITQTLHLPRFSKSQVDYRVVSGIWNILQRIDIPELYS